MGPHGVPDPPYLAQMTFTQCTNMSELKFDSVAQVNVKFFMVDPYSVGAGVPRTFLELGKIQIFFEN